VVRSGVSLITLLPIKAVLSHYFFTASLHTGLIAFAAMICNKAIDIPGGSQIGRAAMSCSMKRYHTSDQLPYLCKLLGSLFVVVVSLFIRFTVTNTVYRYDLLWLCGI
jgi:hypothetical protein